MRSWESLVARLRHDWSARELSDQFFGIPDEAQNSRAEERRDPREVMTDLVSQLRQQFEAKNVRVAEAAGDERDAVSPNLDRLTVGVDLGDQWRNCCILGLGG